MTQEPKEAGRAVGVYLTAAEWEKLERIARRSGMKRGGLLTFAVRYFLRMYELGKVTREVEQFEVLKLP